MDSNVKEEAIDMIRRLPDESTLNDIVEALYLKAKLERSLEHARAGLTISQEEIERRFARRS